MFTCEICNYHSPLKFNYERHLNSKKHKKKVELLNRNKVTISKPLEHEHKMNTNEHKMNTNEHKMNTNEHKQKSNFVCSYCGMTFNTKPSMRRHQLHYCKQNETDLRDELQKERTEKRKLYKHIELLLENNGQVINNIHNTINNNNTNNIQQTNNIVIKNYGEEDLSHITNSVLEKLITTPGNMINNLTKMIHFNNNKPENMNMYIPSRKQKFIKVFRKNKWMLEKKHERIPDLVDRNYSIIDTFYEDQGGSDNLDKSTKKYYEQYQKLIDNKDDKIIKQEYDACELEILNNSEKVMSQHNLTN